MKLPKSVKEFFVKEGQKGGKKAAANLTAKQRTDRARKAGQARQAKAK